jgi:drug/metabolite transporter (DMT)-like permease
MSVTAVILLIIAACTHAGWNFLGKRQHPTAAFFLLANTIGVVCVLPVLTYYWSKVPLIPMPVWGFLGLTGFFLALYMTALAGAYRTGDMSVAYPLARSSPVIVVMIVTLVLGRGNEVGTWCVVGIILVVSGCFMLPMRTFRDFHLSTYLNLCCLLAVLAAIGTAGYTIVDDEALRRLRELSGSPFAPVDATLVYIALEGISTSLWMSLFVFFSGTERRRLVDSLRLSKGQAALTGITIYVTYGLVLASMAYVKNVSYVAAFRQLSIPLGAVLGMVFLKEPHCRPRVVGVAVILVGLALVRTG